MKKRTKNGRLGRLAGSVLVGTVAALAVGTMAWAHAPSDPRATFVSGSATTCSQLGFASSTKMGDAAASASDANVSGTIKPNAGSVNPGQGTELNVAITGSNIVIDVVLVSGSGDAYNKYTNQTYLPPTLPPDQHYIAPLTSSGGSVPNISQWFVCYHTGTPIPTGAIGVFGMTGITGIGFGLLSWRSRRRRGGVR